MQEHLSAVPHALLDSVSRGAFILLGLGSQETVEIAECLFGEWASVALPIYLAAFHFLCAW